MSDIDVFISYKREERSLADQVSRALKNAGYVAVTDLNIQKATDFGEAIDRMIREAKVVVVLWTEASAASDWVRKEANEAERQDKYFGIRIEPVTLDDLPFRVRENNWLDLSDAPFENGLPELVDEVRGLVGPPRKTEQQASAATKAAEGDLEFYQVVHDIGAAPGYERYIKTYPQGTYVEEAKQHIRRLQSPVAFLKRVPFWAAIGTAAAVVAAYAAVQTIPDEPQDHAKLNAQVENLQVQLRNANEDKLSLAAEAEKLQKALETEQERAKNASATTEEMPMQLPQGKGENAPDCADMDEPVIVLAEIDLCVSLTTVNLDLSDQKLSDIRPLKHLDDLQILDLRRTNVTNIKALGEIPSLRSLSINGAPVTDLSPLERLTDLTWLSVGDDVVSKISDLAPISGHTDLRTLYLDNTQFSDTTQLSKLVRLEDLSLWQTDVTDLGGLASLKALRILYLKGLNINDISVLADMRQLHFLLLPNGTVIGSKAEDTPENRAAVQEAIANWKPE